MSNDSPTQAAAEPRMVPLARINIAEGHNPRSDFDPAELAELTASVRQYGVITPVLVCPDEKAKGDYQLVAGERRYRAACEAALTEIPAVVRHSANGDRLDLAITENLQRADLNPIDEARGFERALAEGSTQAQLAERLGIKARRISESLRLLRQPEPVQEHIVSGALAVSVAKPLERIAKVAPDVGAAVAQLVVDGQYEPADLADSPGRLVAQAAGDSDSALVCVSCARWDQHPITDLPLPDDQAEALAERAQQVTGLDEPAIAFSDEDVDAARAYGCLLEFDGDAWMASRFICDAVFLADRVSAQIDATAKRLAKQAKEAAAADPDGAGGQDEPEPGVPDPEQDKQDRKEQREAERADRIEARGANLELGRKLADKFHEPKLTKDVARLIALCALDGDTAHLAGRGLRYVRDDWQEDQSHELKSGERREKIAYLEAHEAEEALWAWFEQARTPEQMIGRVVQALIAARHADDTAVAESRRTYYSLPGSYSSGPASDVPGLVEKLAKRVLPKRLADQLAEREQRGQ